MLFSPRYSSTEILGVKCLFGLWRLLFYWSCEAVVLVQIQQTDVGMLIYSQGPQRCDAAVSINTQEEEEENFTVTKYLDPSSFQSSSLYQNLLKKKRSHQKLNHNCEHKVWGAICKTPDWWFLNQLASTNVNTAATDEGAAIANYQFKKCTIMRMPMLIPLNCIERWPFYGLAWWEIWQS